MKRVTAIVGAGAVLDFDFSFEGAVFPSCNNITEIVKKLKVDGLDVEKSDVIEKVYNVVNNKLNDIYRKRGLKGHSYTINFEELFFALESMLPQGVEYLIPTACPPLSLIEEPISELKDYPSVEVARGLYAIIRKVTEIVDGYDKHFRQSDNNEVWFRKFWKSDEKHRWDVFTFNYDTTIEHSIIDIEDGYEQLGDDENFESFVPKKLIKNASKLSTVQHLHGCIYYAESAPWPRHNTHGNRDMFKYKSVHEALHFLGLQQKAENQAREEFVNSPILIGMRKLDKMTYLPNSVYHANLINQLQKNKGLMIVGYSFGDMYVNQLLQRRMLMHGDKHRLVIIDCFPSYIDSAAAFRSHLYDHRTNLLAFLSPFINFSFDDHFRLQGIDFTSFYEPIYSEDYRCMFLICGFKKAVELHGELIQKFLDGCRIN